VERDPLKPANAERCQAVLVLEPTLLGGKLMTFAELEQRRTAALKHGAHSTAQTAPIARAQKRRFLRRNGLKASRLSGVQLAYLEAWARTAAKVEAIDHYVAANGLIRDDGEPQPALKLYVSLVNANRLAMTKLEESLRADKADGDDTLSDYIERTYGGDDGG
jgi:hypothetical protein